MWKVFHAYGWSPTSVEQRGGVWEIINGEHKYALKESSAPPEKLKVLHRMLEQVRAAGYPHLLPWVESEDGEVVVSAYGSQWYATPWKNPVDQHVSAIELASSLGWFHRLAEPVAAQFPKLHQVLSDEEKDAWQHRLEQVNNWQSASEAQISDHSTKNLSKNSFTFAIKGLERFVDTEKGIAPRYTICHERIHPSNVLASEDGLFWIDFDHAELSSPARDLATLIHRFPEESPAEILAAYEQENKLLPKEKRLLAIYLSYPERIVRAVERQTDEVDIEREQAHLSDCQDLVKNLWPAKKKSNSRKGHQHKRKR